MEHIENVSVESCVSSRFVQPYRVTYTQNGEAKYWDCIKTHNSVSILIFNKTSKKFVFVRQFRPAVYMTKHKELWENSPVFNSTPLSHKPVANSSSSSGQEQPHHGTSSPPSTTSSYGPGSEGCAYELCAGIVDKNVSLQQVAQEEILEETGYKVSADSLEFITSFCTSIGSSGSVSNLFYCEVTEEMHVSQGGGQVEEGECIEVVQVPVDDAMSLAFDSNKVRSSGLCFAVLWFHRFKKGTF